MTVTFVVVLLARLLVPLAIPRYPLPAIMSALVIDAADQTIFQHFGGLPADYQSYDKALDIYYLVIAYASTMRNWQDPVAFHVGRFLWYFRLVGVVAFELTGHRVLLLIFPNTFEYFFIAYEAIRVWWNPLRLRPIVVVELAAGIWIFIKLPQEWWIHIAQLDVTDELGRHRWALPVLIVLILVAVGALVAVWPRLPARDWPPTVRVDDHEPERSREAPSPAAILSVPFLAAVAEKLVLVSLVSVIFAKVLQVHATHTQVVLAVAGLVVLNATISQVFARRGTSWPTTVGQFVAMTGVNSLLVLVFVLRRARIGADVDPSKALAFLLLLSLIITLYDRYRTMRERILPPEPACAQVLQS